MKLLLCFIVSIALVSCVFAQAGSRGNSRNTSGRLINVNLTLWRHNAQFTRPVFVASRQLRVPQGATVLRAMQLAQQADNKFRFTTSLTDRGQVITSIGGLKDDKTHSVYWQTYVMPVAPDIAKPPGSEFQVERAVDRTTVKSNVLMYLQRVYV